MLSLTAAATTHATTHAVTAATTAVATAVTTAKITVVTAHAATTDWRRIAHLISTESHFPPPQLPTSPALSNIPKATALAVRHSSA